MNKAKLQILLSNLNDIENYKYTLRKVTKYYLYTTLYNNKNKIIIKILK